MPDATGAAGLLDLGLWYGTNSMAITVNLTVADGCLPCCEPVECQDCESCFGPGYSETYPAGCEDATHQVDTQSNERMTCYKCVEIPPPCGTCADGYSHEIPICDQYHTLDMQMDDQGCPCYKCVPIAGICPPDGVTEVQVAFSGIVLLNPPPSCAGGDMVLNYNPNGIFTFVKTGGIWTLSPVSVGSITRYAAGQCGQLDAIPVEQEPVTMSGTAACYSNGQWGVGLSTTSAYGRNGGMFDGTGPASGIVNGNTSANIYSAAGGVATVSW